MLTPKRRLVILLIVASVIAAAIGVWSLFVADGRYDADLAQIEKPASVEAYERILAELKGRPTEGEDAARFEPFPEDALDIITGYERLLAHVEKALNGPATDYVGEVLAKRPDEWTDAERSRASEFLMANQHLLGEIRHLADRGGPVYPLDFSKGYEMELPHLRQIRWCARLLRANAIVNGMKGDYAEAVDDIIAGMKLGDALAPESILIPQLVRMVIYGIMNTAVEDAFDEGGLSPELISRLTTHVALADNRHAFAESFRGEVYCAGVHFSEFRATGRVEPSILGPVYEPDNGPAVKDLLAWGVYMSPVGRRWWNMDEQTYAAFMDRFAALAELPYYQAAPELKQIHGDIQDLPRNRVVTLQMLPAMTGACQAQARHEAMLDLLQLGILVEEYKMREGSCPATLDAIAADLGGSLPVDPFTGEGYHYKPTEDSFLLYSVGQNCVDDGGTHDFKEGDIVWRGEEKRPAEAAG
jgi:hypothetical protein